MLTGRLCGACCSREPDEHPAAITDYYRDTFRVIGRGRWSFVKVYSSGNGWHEHAVKIRLKQHMPVTQRWKYAEKHKWKFDKEEKILKTLAGHPNIVSFTESFTEQAQHCQVFELLFGGDLYKCVIDKYGGSHCENNVVGYMRDILNGLQYCHDNKIIHRNVIPPNLFLADSPNGEKVKLVGFSLAFDAKNGAGWHGFVGTAGYRAPEITWVNPYDYAVDIFACGCILYNLLTGSHPFVSHTSEGPSFLSPAWELVSEVAKDLVMNMLNYDRCRRITATQALDHPFFRDAERAGVNNPLTIAVEGLTEFTEHKLWETVASNRNMPYLRKAPEYWKSKSKGLIITTPFR